MYFTCLWLAPNASCYYSWRFEISQIERVRGGQMDKMCISLLLELKSAAQCSKNGRNSAIKNIFTSISIVIV